MLLIVIEIIQKLIEDFEDLLSNNSKDTGFIINNILFLYSFVKANYISLLSK